jgi:hypothetical protein
MNLSYVSELTREKLVRRWTRLSYATIGYNRLEAIASWWADPVAALCMVPIIMSEGIDGLRAKARDDCC